MTSETVVIPIKIKSFINMLFVVKSRSTDKKSKEDQLKDRDRKRKKEQLVKVCCFMFLGIIVAKFENFHWNGFRHDIH